MLSITDAETLIIINFQTWFCHFEANFPSQFFLWLMLNLQALYKTVCGLSIKTMSS